MELDTTQYLHVGSSTDSVPNNGKDIDVVAIVESVSREILFKASNTALGICVSKNLCDMSASIELRHGPFKNEQGKAQIHLLIHTPQTIQQVSLATRICWAETAGWFTGQQKVEHLLSCTSPSINELRSTCHGELNRIFNMVETHTIRFREWNEIQPISEYMLVEKAAPLNSIFELNVLLRHALRSTQFNLSIWPNAANNTSLRDQATLMSQADELLISLDVNNVDSFKLRVLDFLYAVAGYYRTN